VLDISTLLSVLVVAQQSSEVPEGLMNYSLHHVGRFKGNDEEDEWLLLVLCFSHQKYEKKNKTRGFFFGGGGRSEANID